LLDIVNTSGYFTLQLTWKLQLKFASYGYVLHIMNDYTDYNNDISGMFCFQKWKKMVYNFIPDGNDTFLAITLTH